MELEKPECEWEKNVGIEEYLSKGESVEGITKFLISDFIVNEVDSNGNVVMLKSKDKPIFGSQQNGQSVSLALTNEKREILTARFSQQAISELSTLYGKLDSKEKVQKWSIEIPCPESKQERTQLHQFIREHLPFIESKNDQGKFTLTYAKVFKRVKKTNQYIHFKLMKSNIDTPGAIYKLSKIMNLNPKLFSVAGLKDKRGITTQMVSLYNCELDVFNKFYKVAERTRQIWIGQPVEHQQDKVALGDLYGNKFALAIRFTKAREQILSNLQKNIQKLQQHGFINYFGMQRFGSRQVGTHLIGVQVLKKNFQKIIEMLILQQTRDKQFNELKKQVYESGNFKKAQSFPNKYQIEKNLLFSLDRHGKNFSVVFETLPRTNRCLYGHALQSYLWNKTVSQRIRTYGTELKIGDFVAKSKKKTIQNIEQQQGQNEGQQVIEEEFQVQKITNENIKNYTPFDILIPLYGSSTIPQFPEYLKPFVDAQLKKFQLQDSMFITGLPKSLMLVGGYRKMLNRVQDLTWNITNYSQKNEELQNGFYYLSEQKDKSEGKYFALRIKFGLSKSSYATMVIRQLLKTPSSFSYQQTLNKKYNSLQ